MGDQLAIDIEVIFFDGGTKSRDVNGDMDNAEEGQSKHGRNGAG